jgi:hypothetical protein
MMQITRTALPIFGRRGRKAFPAMRKGDVGGSRNRRSLRAENRQGLIEALSLDDF